MPKITQTQVGQVFLKLMPKAKWRASWTDPLTKKHVRRVLPGTALKEVKAQAEAINATLAQGKGFGGRLRGSSGHRIDEAVLEAIKHSDANEATRKDYIYRYRPFADYINSNLKGITAWTEVTEQLIENYIEHGRKKDLAPDTLRLRIFVLKLTSAYMARTYPGQYRDVAIGIRIRKRKSVASEQRRRDSILTPEQIRGLIEHLRQTNPRVHLWALCQGLCGMRMFEAAYLREQDIDFNESCLTIASTVAYSLKNASSLRTIPVPPSIVGEFARWISTLEVRHPEGYLFVPERTNPSLIHRGLSAQSRAGVYTQDRVRHLWAATLKECRKSGVDLPESFTPRKLRMSFVKAMRTSKADFETLQTYIGHRPNSILAEHYDDIDLMRLRSISVLGEQLISGEGMFAARCNEAIKVAE